MSQKDEDKKIQLEGILCKDSMKKTVQETLDNIKEITKITKIGPLPKYDNEGAYSSFQILAVYKDGSALTCSDQFLNIKGEKHKYFLHRNGEDQAYHLSEISIIFR